MAYTFFTLKEEPEELIEDFSKEKDGKFEKEVKIHIASATFKIPKRYSPEWEEDYLWKRIDIDIDREAGGNLLEKHCYMIYFPNTLQLAICEYFN